MTRAVSKMERARPSQVLSMTLLTGLAWLPLITDIEHQVSAYIGFLVALRLMSLRWPVLLPGRGLLLGLTLAGMANVFSANHTFLGQEGGTSLLATMMALKLLETHRLRDVRVGTVLFGFLLVSQFLFAQSPLRTLYLALLLLFDFALMADLTARTENGRQALFSALRTAGRLCLQALPLALILFVLFPRFSTPLWSIPQPGQSGFTGMDDWMEPGSVSELVLSGEPAFRVRFDGPIPAEDRLYWRGPVVWHTDGRRWTSRAPGAPLGSAEPAGRTSDEIAYQVELEPTGKHWLFALDLPIQVPADARILGDFRVMASKPIKSTRIYRAVSALRHDGVALDLDHQIAGTQVPANTTARMRALVARWQESAGGDAEALVHRALGHFSKEPFYYSLSPPRLGSKPADEFLFETRRGFCEHYAGSFALLMRIAHIPARIVLGYMGGEHNPLGDYVIVRQSDAHAWVEIWLDGRGWVRVDPTAAVAPWRVERSDLLQGLGAGAPMRFRLGKVDALRRWAHNLDLLGDAIARGWRDWVVNLSSARQQRMLEAVGLGHLRGYGLALVLIIAAGVVLALLLAALIPRTGPRDPLEQIYADFCGRLARIGLPRGSAEGPQDFSQRVIAARPDLSEPVGAFMAIYLPQRYGPYAQPQARLQLKHGLRRFRPHRRLKP